jgi:hypothetical protein
MSQRQFSEDEIRALEAEMEKLTVEDVLLQTLVTLINLKAGLASPPGDEEPKRDLAQTKKAIDGARALLPLVEDTHGAELAPFKDALSRLQMAYVQLSGDAPSAAPQAEKPAEPGSSGPAQSSGRLWVPGQ